MPFLNLGSLIRSFRYASKGLVQVFREEQNFRLQILVALGVLILALYLQIRIIEIIFLILVIIIVLVLELINSIFERLIDILKPRLHPDVRAVKDIMAATVLIASVGSVIIAVFIFWPYLF